MTYNCHWTIDTDDFCLSANFSNAAGEFTDFAPAAVTEARKRYPELSRLEDKIWEDSQPTGLNGIGIIPTPHGYTLFIVEHTHPFTWGFGTLPDRTMRGPSPADFVMARNNPHAFHVLQAKPPRGKPREFLYFGARK